MGHVYCLLCLFALPLPVGVIGMLCSVNVTLSGHLLYCVLMVEHSIEICINFQFYLFKILFYLLTISFFKSVPYYSL